jgi:Fe/S biogenesis protein NfuA
VIAIHAERVVGEPSAVRWVIPPGLLTPGHIGRAPGALGQLFTAGKLTDGMAEHAAVWLWLRDGLSWRREGQAVDHALRDALRSPADWQIEPAPGDVLERVTADLLDGSVGDFLRSHGGSATARRLDDDIVEVQLGGACEHCSAARHTLRLRLLGELRRRCPDLVELSGDQAPNGRLTVCLRPTPD